MAARPATRRAMGRSTDAPHRAIVRDLTRGGASYRIDWDVRAAYDFIFSLSGDAGSTEDLPAADREWLVETRKSLPASVQAGISDLFESELAIHTGVLLVDQPDVRTSADVVALVEATTPEDLVGALFADDGEHEDLSALLDQAIAGDTAVLPELAEKLPDWHRKGRLELLRDPVVTKERIVEVLRAWQVPFSAIEARVLAILERDYEERADDRARLSPADLIETTTGGVRYLPEPGISRVILGPSYFSRPYNFLMAAREWRFFGYPVADSALGPSDALTPPLSLVRLHRALGDETRLRILKLLASRDLYLTEIAQQLDLSKPTIKHHMILLRSAGLVTITDAGTVMYYSLRRNRLDDASAEIKDFLVS
ncbi:MAG TPA: metalloregulator ArsR/SmtB family transcription factor [Candidatus Deferrimicrobium sp.]|nr:metalloregulator ArsR/SmtB family transcription factor [Candidatus Deferrimicrobium sp.]